MLLLHLSFFLLVLLSIVCRSVYMCVHVSVKSPHAHNAVMTFAMASCQLQQQQLAAEAA